MPLNEPPHENFVRTSLVTKLYIQGCNGTFLKFVNIAQLKDVADLRETHLCICILDVS